MAFQVSPGINVSEIDLTTVVPVVSTTEGAIVGVFTQGPINQRVLIDSEKNLAARFGKPNANNYETFFSAANFLAYGNKLYVTRVVPDDAINASIENAANTLVETLNEADSATTYGTFVAQSPGTIGNSLMVSVCYDSADFSESVTLDAGIAIGATTVSVANTVVAGTNLATNDILRVGNTTIGYQDLIITNVASESGGSHVLTFTPAYRLSETSSTVATRYWRYYNNVSGAPSGSNSHIVVIDENGTITGTANTILEVYADVSRTSTDKNDQGESIYYKDVINERSNYIWATNSAIADSENYQSLTGGSDGTNATESTIPLSRLARGIDLYQDGDEVDISLFVCGKANTVIANYIIDNICEIRKDCVAFVSPERSDVVNQATGAELDQIIAFRNNLTSSSYGVMDSGYKYQYDKYNDKFRWVPLNGDIAGLCVRTDTSRDPWYSPGGYNRGIIKNVVKLAYNPRKAERDQLYKNDINPVITDYGQGTLLFGDKTLLGKPSAFDRINVRRLFIVMEKQIAIAAKYMLFEFNDEFTRARFRNLVEPYLRDVLGRRGITDYRVICDSTNNTGEVIDRNEFVGDIYVKPARSINFIQLNFVAVRSSVAFEEIIGAFG